MIRREDVDALCAELPGAVRGEPPEELASWKVGGKMFACFGQQDDGDGVSVKTPDAETAAMLIEAGAATRAKYFHRSWVRLPFAGTDATEAAHRIRVSYDTIVASLPKSRRPEG